MANEKRLIDYYVVRNKSTGFYFRGKGVNRWGEYYNQASIYRIKAHAQNTANWLNARGEKVEIVPIRITENPTVDAVEVVRCKDCKGFVQGEPYDPCECMKWMVKFGVAYTTPDGYCHKAERKNENL